MAIEKKLIHFKKWSDFSSKKLSANEQNTQYTLGVDGALTTGAPDILYQSICWIKDVRKMWTHGTVYDCSGGANADLSNYVTQEELDELVEFVDDMNSDISNLINTKQDNITDLQAIREGAAKGATSVQPSDIEDVARKDSGYVIANGILDENDDYWHLPKNSLNDKEHTLASKSDIEAKILVIGDSSDEAKANFIAVANGEKTADIYIGSVDVQGYIIEGCVKLAMSGSSSNRMYSFAIIGNPTSGRYINKFIKVTCLFANGAISSEVEVIDAYSKPSTGIPKTDLDTSVQASLGKADTAVQPADIKDDVYIADFTMESLRTGINNGINVNCNIQALVTAMNANKVILVREDEDSAYKGVYVLNGFAEDLVYFSIVDTSGNILWCEGTDYISSQGIDAQTLHLQNWWEKQDTLVSGENIKTINGESILGSGNITIESGGGTITEIKANGTSIATSGVANIPAASTSAYGVTKLSSATNSTSTTLAATASAVKAAYDLANGKASMSDVNTAIANAITNVINASY